MAAALAQSLGEALLGVAEAVDQLSVARRLLDRVEVGALDVLDDGDLQDLAVVEISYDYGYFFETGLLGRAPAPLAGDDLVHLRVARRDAHHQRLDDPLLADRARQLGECRLVEAAARLVGVGREPVHRQGAVGRPRRLLGGLDVRHQGREAAAEAARPFASGHAAPSVSRRSRSRRPSSAASAR